MYAFGAATSYTLVFVSLLTLRFTDPDTPRSFRVPWNVEVRRGGESYQLPIVGVLGLLGIFSLLVVVIITHPIGRIAGPVWIALGIIGFAFYRRKRGLPITKSVPRDWAAEQLAVYEESGEHELAEEFRENLIRRKHRQELTASVRDR
jgi:APA family basic amino acid/polyamine antiporter